MKELSAFLSFLLITSTAFGLTGGFEPEPEIFASTVRIESTTGYDSCTGAVISDHHILLAAHCVLGSGRYFHTYQPNYYTDTTRLYSNFSSQTQYDNKTDPSRELFTKKTLHVKNVFLHPSWKDMIKFSPKEILNLYEKTPDIFWEKMDLAIIEFDSRIGIPYSKIDTHPLPKDAVVLMGGNGRPEDENVFRHYLRMSEKLVRLRSKNYFALGATNTDGSISEMREGDSGGPVYILKDNEYFIVGVNSMTKSGFLVQTRSFHTRIDTESGAAQWIHAVVNQGSLVPDLLPPLN